MKHRSGRRLIVLFSVFALATVMGAISAPHASADTQTFNFVDDSVPYTVAAGVCAVTIEASAGQGGLSGQSGTTPGLGGRVTATITVTPGETLDIFAGGAGGGASFATASATNVTFNPGVQEGAGEIAITSIPNACGGPPVDTAPAAEAVAVVPSLTG